MFFLGVPDPLPLLDSPLPVLLQYYFRYPTNNILHCIRQVYFNIPLCFYTNCNENVVKFNFHSYDKYLDLRIM